MDMPTDELVKWLSQLKGCDLELYNEEEEIVIGEIESLDIDHPPSLKTWLGFMLYALGERVQQQPSDGE